MIKKDIVYKNTEFIKLEKGDVRIMFDDGKGMIYMDFEKGGKQNTKLKNFVYETFAQMQINGEI